MGMGLGSDDWAHVSQVNAPLTTIIDFTMGQSTMGERLREWGNAVLDAVQRDQAPSRFAAQLHLRHDHVSV